MAREKKSRFNVSPYYDDFDESKKFLRILFRPGYSVQARELSQLQSILNNQLSNFGDHVFDNGSVVRGGEINETEARFVRIESVSSTELALLKGFEIFSGNKRGKVLDVIDNVSDDQTQIVIYEPMSGVGLEADTGTPSLDYAANQKDLYKTNSTFTSTNPNLTTTFTVSASASTNAASSGDCTVISVGEGLFYVEGFFVQNSAQVLTVYYSNTDTNDGLVGERIFDPTKQTAVVGFSLNRKTVTESSDVTLRDPAQGSYNYNAPGADRYQIDLQLSQKHFVYNEDGFRSNYENENFVELVRILQGETFKTVKYPDYAELEKTLARRTYDESGHYEVTPFELEIKEYVDEFIPDNSTNPLINDNGNTAGADNYLAFGIEPGKCYVRGHEFELQDTEYIIGRKARDEDHIKEQVSKLIENDLGNYVLVKNTASKPLFSGQESGSLFYHIPTEGATFDTVVGPKQMKLILSNQSNDRIGCANAVQLLVHTTGGGGIYRLYLNNVQFGEVAGFEEQFNTASISDVVYFSQAGSNKQIFEAEAVGGGTLGSTFGDEGNTNLVYQVPEGNTVKTIMGLDYVVQRDFRVELTWNKSLGYYEGSAGTSTLADNPFNHIPEGFFFAGAGAGDGVIDDADQLDEYIVAADGYVYTFGGGTGDLAGGDNALEIASGGRELKVRINSDGIHIGGSSAGTDNGARKTALVLANIRTNADAAQTELLDSQFRKKTLKRTTIDIPGGSFNQFIQDGNGIDLGISDVYEVEQVLDIASGSKDITEQFDFNDGQKGYLYDHAYLILRDGFDGTAGPGGAWNNTPEGQTLFKVTLTYFEHEMSVSNNYSTILMPACVNSYIHSDHVGITSDGKTGAAFGYETIPAFINPANGARASLRDCIDHRPIRVPSQKTIQNSNLELATGVSPSSVQGAFTPEDGEFYFVSYKHYMGRTDLIVIENDTEFKHIEGIPSMEPIMPTFSEDDGMKLFTLDVPPYTFSPDSLRIEKSDNRRYTMRDIGELDTRLSDVEEKCDLNTAEIETLRKRVEDLENEPFMNALNVDDFSSPERAELNDESNVAYDGNRLRPAVSCTNINLEMESINVDGITLSDDRLITLTPSKEDVAYLSNLEGNTNLKINPTAKQNFVGKLKLSPSSDDWADQAKPTVADKKHLTTSRVAQIYRTLGGVGDVNTANNVLAKQARAYAYSKGAYGLWWNRSYGAWRGFYGRRNRYYRGRGLFGRFARNNWYNMWNNRTLRFNQPDKNRTYAVATSDKQLRKLKADAARRGQTVSVQRQSRYVNTIFGARRYAIADHYVVSWENAKAPARALTFYGIANGLKPNTQHSVYINGKKINQAGTDDKGKNIGAKLTPFKPETQIFTSGAGNTPSGDIAGNRVAKDTVASGAADGSHTGRIAFKVVITEENIFTSGELNVTVSDKLPSTAEFSAGRKQTSTSSSIFTIGDVKTEGNKTGSTRKVEIVQESVSQTKLSTGDRERGFMQKSSVNDKIDPLAQIFTVDPTKNKKGIMATSIDLWFSEINSAVPVEVELRSVVGEQPDPKYAVPLSHVVKMSNGAATGCTFNATSPNVNSYTRFKFDSAIHLEPGDYAITVKANTDKYSLWSTELGRKGITLDGTESVQEAVKQPYIGNLFLPQSNGKRTMDLTKDIMFRVNKAEYDTTTIKTFNVKGVSGSAKNEIRETVQTPTAHKIYVKADIVKKPDTSVKIKTIPASTAFNKEEEVVEHNDIKLDAKTELTMNNKLLSIELKTDNKDISPVLDLDRLSLVAVKNNISTDTTGEENPKPTKKEDVSVSRYLSKTTPLDLVANDVKVELKAAMPADCDVEVYLQVLPDDKDDLTEQKYVKLEKTEESKKIENASDEEDFADYTYKVPSGIELGNYKSYRTKMVFTGNPAKSDVPVVKKLATFALTKKVSTS